MIVLKHMIAAVRNLETHLFARQSHLQVIVLGFFDRSTENFKQVHDVAPMNVVRGGMRKDLGERVVVPVV